MKNKLENGDVISVNVYYENLTVHTEEGEVYFLSPDKLLDVLNQHSFQIVHKKTRKWLYPIVQDDTGTIVLTDEVNERLSSILDMFEHATMMETGIIRISGGFAVAEYSSHNDDWIYVTLKWGVQSDVENNVHEEDWQLSWEHFYKSDSIKKIVQHLEPCN